MTKLTQNETFKTSSIDLLVGGTPCQSFSVAGLRGGLADPRGNLMLTFLSLADAKKPRWIVWENVPGVLSSNGGKDFGTFLGALGELGYGFAYRVLDAQHFGVAQRRRRVFVVGYLGDWRPAAAVLFERESLSRDSKPSRKKGKETPTDAQGSVGEAGDVSCAGGNVSPCVTSKWKTGYGGPSGSNETGNMVYEQVAQPQYFENHAQDSRVTGPHDVGNTVSANYGMGGGNTPLVSQPFRKVRRAKSETDFETCEKDEKANTLNCFDQGDVRSTNVVAQPVHAFKVRGGCEGGGKGYLGEDEKAFTISTMQDQHIAQPIPIHDQATRFQGKRGDKQDGKGNGFGIGDEGDVMNTLTKADKHAVAQPIAVDTYNYTTNEKTTQTIRSQSDTEHIGAVLEPTIIDRAAFNQGQNAQYEPRIEEGQTMSSLVAKGPHAVQHTMAIRRLTPKECERLQGFPDDWTKIPYRNKPADQCPDGPRYKACGNSMAVPVMRWIGQRIQLIDTIIN